MIKKFVLLFLLTNSCFALIDPATALNLMQQLDMLRQQYKEIKKSGEHLDGLNQKFKKALTENNEIKSLLEKQGKKSFYYNKNPDHDNGITSESDYLKELKAHYDEPISSNDISNELKNKLPNEIEKSINKNHTNYELYMKQHSDAKKIAENQKDRIKKLKELENTNNSITGSDNNQLDSLHQINQQNQLLLQQNEQVISLLNAIYESQNHIKLLDTTANSKSQKHLISDLQQNSEEQMSSWLKR